MEKYDLFSGLGNSDEGPLEIPEYMNMDGAKSPQGGRSASGTAEPRKTLLRVTPERKNEKKSAKSSGNRLEQGKRGSSGTVRKEKYLEDYEADYDPDYGEDYGDEEDGAAGRPHRGSFHALTYVITAAVVVAAVIAAIVLLGRRQFDSYRVLRTERLEDTVTSSYANVNGNILQYGTDKARLQTRQGEEIWNLSYSLKGPELVRCGNTLALYDQGGTDIVVAGRDGKLGAFTAKLPIVKASVSAQGNVAAILEDGANAWIEYYGVDGTEIAAIKTSIDNPGYPMAVAVSPNGQLLAVSYLSFADGIQKSEVHIYSFGSAGQNQMDNRIGAFTYSQTIFPELVYLNDNTCVAFRDTGFTLIEGTKVPKVTKEVDMDREICSIFHDSDHIGLVVVGDGEGSYRMHVYNPSGNELLDQPFDFPFSSVEIYGSDISLYDGSAFEVYGMNGIRRFSGSYSGDARKLFAVGKQRYVAVTDSGFELIELR